MARYKVLGSVAHNLGHSFLSDMNYVADRRQRSVIVPQQIFEISRDTDACRSAPNASAKPAKALTTRNGDS